MGKTELVGKTELAGKTQMAGKTEVVGKTEIAGKTEWAGKTVFVGKTEMAGKIDILKPMVHSVDVATINEYLKSQWQHAVGLRGSNDLAASLAEISSAWFPDRAIRNHFYIRFGAPEIKAPCPHEVILLFHVESIAWYDGSNFTLYAVSS